MKKIILHVRRRADPGIYERGQVPLVYFLSPFSFSFPSSSLFLLLDAGPLNQLESTGRKRIRCQKATGDKHFEYSEHHVLQ